MKFSFIPLLILISISLFATPVVDPFKFESDGKHLDCDSNASFSEDETKDLSNYGVYIAISDFEEDLNSQVSIVFPEFPDKRFIAGIVRKDKDGIGLAFRQLSREDRDFLDSILGERI